MHYRCHVGSVVVGGQTGLLDGVGRSPDTGCEFVTWRRHDIVGKVKKSCTKRYRKKAKRYSRSIAPLDVCDWQLLSVVQLWSSCFLFGTIYRTWSIDRENVTRPSENGPG